MTVSSPRRQDVQTLSRLDRLAIMAAWSLRSLALSAINTRLPRAAGSGNAGAWCEPMDQGGGANAKALHGCGCGMVRYVVLRSIGMKRTASVVRNSRSNAALRTSRKASRSGRSFVLCIDNRSYPASLERGKVYRTVKDTRGSRHGLIRVFDESGEGYLYSRDRFVPVRLPAKARRAVATRTA